MAGLFETRGGTEPSSKMKEAAAEVLAVGTKRDGEGGRRDEDEEDDEGTARRRIWLLRSWDSSMRTLRQRKRRGEREKEAKREKTPVT